MRKGVVTALVAVALLILAAQPPGGGPLGPTQARGNWKAGPDGKFDARPFSQPFPDGHYKLTVNTGMGAGKHKVFWVRCGTPGTPGTTSPANTTASANSSSAAEMETQASAAVASAAAINAAAKPSASANSNAAVAGVQSAPQQMTAQLPSNSATTTTRSTIAGVQNLPSTSTTPDVTPLALLGFALMGAGGALL